MTVLTLLYTCTSIVCSLHWMFSTFYKSVCNTAVAVVEMNSIRFKVDLMYNNTEVNTIYYKPKNQEWNVDQVTVQRHEKTYACCVEPYPDVTFTIHMTRRSLFYIVNLIFPCLLIYAVSFLGFFLPVESGEKVNLQITILLALVVFLLIVGETLPPTPDAIPVLGKLRGSVNVLSVVAYTCRPMWCLSKYLLKCAPCSVNSMCFVSPVSPFRCFLGRVDVLFCIISNQRSLSEAHAGRIVSSSRRLLCGPSTSAWVWGGIFRFGYLSPTLQRCQHISAAHDRTMTVVSLMCLSMYCRLWHM